jgi:hypothetical protein
MMKRFATLAALTVAALSFAGQANAAYTLTLTALNPTALNANGTQYVFSIPDPNPKSGTLITGQPFNVINVAEPVASDNGSGSVTLSENFSIVGTGNTPGTLNGTLTGLFTVSGGTSTFTNFSITNLVGSGFTVSNIGYAQPSVGSSSGSLDSGNVSFVVTPTAAVAVPEPTSVAVLGLGLAGLSVVSFFRRRRRA